VSRQPDTNSAENESLADRGFQELLNRVERLEHSLALLDRRLQNVEASAVFKFLRWLGGKLGLGLARNDTPGRYAAWAQETEFRERLERVRQTALPQQAGCVSIVIDARGAEPEKFAKTLKSIARQTHSRWELAVDAGSESAEWVKACVAEYTGGRRAGIGGVSETALTGEFTAFIHPHSILDAGLLEDWLRFCESGTAAVYSDWDHIDSSGRRHSPRFTPEFSPSLLLQTNYFGTCLLARTAVLRALGWPELAAKDVPARLAEARAKIRRIPRILWHLQDSPADFEDPRPFSGPGPAASMIVCTRNPARLEKSLRALSPPPGSRHEIVTVIHGASGGSSKLEQIATAAGARPVRFEGPFHFGEMNRLGVEASRNEVLAFLNDDVYPLEKTWLDRMSVQAATKDVGIVGALLLYPNRTIQHAGIVVGSWRQPTHLGRGQTGSPLWPWLRMTREVTAVTGACMVLRRAIWDELGGFDPQFPVNYNDVDLCLRAGERGYRVLLEAGAVLIHEEARTRIATVSPEESARFFERWSQVAREPDRFFNPQLTCDHQTIELPPPWTAVR